MGKTFDVWFEGPNEHREWWCGIGQYIIFGGNGNLGDDARTQMKDACNQFAMRVLAEDDNRLLQCYTHASGPVAVAAEEVKAELLQHETYRSGLTESRNN